MRWSAGSGLLLAFSLLTALGFPGQVRGEAQGLIGLGASSEYVWQALHNRQGLDVRDEQGRAVSAAVIEAELKGHAAARAAEAGIASSLPEARAIFRLLEFWTIASARVGPIRSNRPGRDLGGKVALAPRKLENIFIMAAFGAAGSCSGIRRVRQGLFDFSDLPGVSRPLVLRC